MSTRRSMMVLVAMFAIATSWPISLRADDLIGKRAWIVGVANDQIGVEVARSSNDIRNTVKMRTGSFVLGKRLQGKHFYEREVTLDNGRKGFISPIAFQFLTLIDPSEAERDASAECTRRGQPKIGMTPAELTETCWGKPRRVVKKTTAAGVEENYVYGIGHIVTLRDGKVAEIVETR